MAHVGVVTSTAHIMTPSRARAAGTFHTVGGQIVDMDGRRSWITGINWFGLETCAFAPHGLWARNWQALLDQIVRLHYNTIRLPFSEQILDPHSMPAGINYTLNPDLRGLSGLQVMDRIIAGAGARGLKVILDQHREHCGNGTETALWYTAAYPQSRWLASWRFLAQRYAANPAVIGADLHNEPHGQATWGDGDPARDWRLAAERGGNAILAVAPHWLIFVEGIERVGEDWYWWGGNLSAAGRYPVRLAMPGRLVYEAHDYGPGVAPQAWFHDPSFPHNLPGVWQRHWAYLVTAGAAPVLVGEFGGQSFGKDPEGLWQRTLIAYLRIHHVGYTYWALNPDSGDTGGLLQNDWQSVDVTKEALLSTLQAPLLGAPTGRFVLPAGTSTIPASLFAHPPTTVSSGDAASRAPHASAQRPGVAIGAVVSYPKPLTPGGTVVLDLRLTERTPIVGAILDVEIANVSGAKVFQTWRRLETLTAGATLTMRVMWTVPENQVAGPYRVGAGVFSADWSRLYDWDNAADSVVIAATHTAAHAARRPLHHAFHRVAGPVPMAPPRTTVPLPASAPISATIKPEAKHAAPGAQHETRRAPALARAVAPQRRQRQLPPVHLSGVAHITALRHLPEAAGVETLPARAVHVATRAVAAVTHSARMRVPRRVHARAPRGGVPPARPSQSTGIAIATSTTVTVRAAGLRLRSGPSLNATVYALLDAGTTLHADRLTPHWMHVTVFGSSLSGWVFRAYVSP